MRDQRTALILIVIGFVLIIAGFQGKLGAVFAALFSPADVVLDAGATSGTIPAFPDDPGGSGGGSFG